MTPNRMPFITCVRVVSALILADEVITDEENAFIERLMDDMSFSPDERAAAAQPIDLDAGLEQVRALSTPLKKTLLETLIKASRSDGHIDNRELAFVERVAHAFGLPEDAIGELWVAPSGRPAQHNRPLDELDLSRLQPSDEGEDEA